MPERKIDPKFNIHSSYRKLNLVNPYRYGGTSGGGVDADYQAVLNFAEANSIPVPSANQRAIDNQFLIDYKATRVWEKDDVFFKFKGTADPLFKLIDWKRLIVADAYGGLTWTVDGVKGNGSSGYIDPKAVLNELTHFQQNDASVSFVTYDIGSSGTRAIMGLNVGSGIAAQLIIANNDTSYTTLNSDGLRTGDGNFAYTGLTTVNRLDSVSINRITDTTVSVVKGSLSPNSYSPYILARNRVDTSGVDLFHNAGLSFFRMGASINQEHASLKTVLE